MIKNRSLAKDFYGNIPYAVLGLGDTNYDKFCFMGKAIDKRMSEIGGTRALSLACADEATNLEEVAEKWKVDVVAILTKMIIALKANEKSLDDDNKSAVTDMNDDNNSSKNGKNPRQYLLDGIKSLLDVFLATNINSDTVSRNCDLATIPKYNKPTAPKQSNGLTFEILSTGSIETSLPVSEDRDSNIKYSAEYPFRAAIRSARWLTKTDKLSPPPSLFDWGSKKRVVHMELSLEDSGLLYSPGDSIGILAPNPSPLVTGLLARLNENPSHSAQPLTLSTMVRWKDEVLTIEELLSYR